MTYVWSNFLYIYFIMLDSMDMICIVLKKNYYSQPLLQLLFWKKLTNWIFKKPIGPTQSSKVSLKKTRSKINYFSIIVLTWGE